MARTLDSARRANPGPSPQQLWSQARREELKEVPSHLLGVKDVSDQYLELLLKGAEEMKVLVETRGGDDRLNRKIIALVFYEVPSTRTSCSFQAAMQRLGGTVININEKDSSAQKGESIKDTTQTLASYCDAVVLRHPMKGAAQTAASVSSKPVINAGDGTGEHPTQALLDIFTIKSELGAIGSSDPQKPMVVTLLGDLKNGRTVHSLVRLLAKYPNVKLVFVAPSILAMPAEIIEELAALDVEQTSVMTLEDAIGITDVLYVTRIQKERFDSVAAYEEVAGCYCVDAALMTKAKKRMIVMHPLPRLGEIHTDVDSDPRAAYFRQMKNGMYMRMAILDSFLTKESPHSIQSKALKAQQTQKTDGSEEDAVDDEEVDEEDDDA